MSVNDVEIDSPVMAGVDFVKEAVRAMTAYTLEPRVARDKWSFVTRSRGAEG